MKKNNIYILTILLFSLLFLFVYKNYYLGDDTLFHTTNIIANTSSKTLFLPRIIPNLLNNLGYGINIFYPPLPHLLGTILYRMIKDINIVIKILQWLSIFLSGLTMYHYTKTIFKNEDISLTASLFYMSMPYLFTDIFTRGALNESFLFPLLPLIFLSFHYLFQEENKKFYLYFITGFTLAIYTHLVLTIYITVVSIIYLLISYKKIPNIKKILKATILVLFLTSSFIIPLLEHFLTKNYTIFLNEYTKENSVVVLSFYNYLLPTTISSGAGNILRFYINPLALLFMILTCISFYLKKVKENHKRTLITFFIITILIIIIESITIIWNIIPNILKNIQFSWRLSLIVSFTSSIVASFGITIIKKKKIIIPIIIILLATLNFYYITKLPNKTNFKPENNTCCLLQWQQEYLPKNALNNKDYLSTLQSDTIRINNEKIKIKSTSKKIVFKIDNISNSTEIEIPRLYYLGYEFKNEDNKIIPIKENNNGLIKATIKRKGTYTLTYKGTNLSKVSIPLMIIALVIILKYILKK